VRFDGKYLVNKDGKNDHSLQTEFDFIVKFPPDRFKKDAFPLFLAKQFMNHRRKELPVVFDDRGDHDEAKQEKDEHAVQQLRHLRNVLFG
jgi:hypothetical protein